VNPELLDATPKHLTPELRSGAGLGAAPLLADYPEIHPRKIHYMPKRCGAYGQAEYRHPKYDLDGPMSFEVRGWADANKRKCQKSKAAYAIVSTCTFPALMLLSANADISDPAGNERGA